MTRLARIVAVCVAAASLLSVAPPRASALARPCASGSIHVAVVVDFGSGSSVSSACVAAKAGMKDYEVLGLQHSVRYGSSGLVCGIDGFPASGCPELHNGHYDMWTYWHGENGHWTYANDSFYTRLASEDVVIGWRWTPGANASPSDPAPRGSASATSICPPAPPAPQGSPAPAPAPGANTPAKQNATPRPASTSATNSTTPVSTSANSPATTLKSTRASGESATTFDALGASASARPHGNSSSGPPIGLFAGVVLIAALAAGGILVARRRRRATT